MAGEPKGTSRVTEGRMSPAQAEEPPKAEVQDLDGPETLAEQEAREQDMYARVRTQLALLSATIDGIKQPDRTSQTHAEVRREIEQYLTRARNFIETHAETITRPTRIYDLAVSEYMEAVEQVEGIILQMEDQEERGVRAPITVVDWSKHAGKAGGLEMVDTVLKLTVHPWMRHHLSTYIDDSETLALARSDRHLDQRYEDALLKSSMTATAEMTKIAQALILRAGLELNSPLAEGTDDFRSEVHRAKNALQVLEEDWKGRGVEPVSEKYGALQSGLDRMVRLVAGRHVGKVVPIAVDREIMVNDHERNLLRPDASEQDLYTALERAAAKTHYILNAVHAGQEDAQQVNGLLQRLERILQSETAILARVEALSEYDEQRHMSAQRAHMSRMAKTEALINAVDSVGTSLPLRQFSMTDFRTFATNHAQWLEVDEMETKLDIDFGAYVQAFVADTAMVSNNQNLAQNDSVLDQGYAYAMLEPGHNGVNRRITLERLIQPLILRASIDEMTMGRDDQGNTNRARNALLNLYDDWSKRFPPVAEKYRLLLDQFEDILAVTGDVFLEQQ